MSESIRFRHSMSEMSPEGPIEKGAARRVHMQFLGSLGGAPRGEKAEKWFSSSGSSPWR